jgi:hypothetical protein
MNTLSINTPQPAFKGVKITSNFTHVKRPFTYIKFRIVPDSDVKGIRIGKRTLLSSMADTITHRFSDVASFKQTDKNSIIINNTNDFSNFNLRAFLKIMVSYEAGFRPNETEKMLEFMENQKLTVQRTNNSTGFDILVGKDLIHELEILRTPHPEITKCLASGSKATNQAL